jgi:hypothetical protein
MIRTCALWSILKDGFDAGPKLGPSCIQWASRANFLEKVPLSIHCLPAACTSAYVPLKFHQVFVAKFVVKIKQNPLTILFTWRHVLSTSSGG